MNNYNVVIYPPNKPLERVLEPSKTPVLYDYLLYIDSNSKGQIILGSSNVAGTYWEGTILHYESFEKAKKNQHRGFFISNSTSADGIFLDDDNILFAEDNGYLTILNTHHEEGDLLNCYYKYCRGYPIQKLASWGSSKAVACYDRLISVYDISADGIKQERSFENYHVDFIMSVDTNKMSESLFASCSMDRKACVWDIRMDNPVKLVYQNEFCSLTSVVWINQNHVVVGSEAGDVYVIDTRKPEAFVSKNACFESSIHKMALNNSGLLAVCGNTPQINIFRLEGNDLEIVKESNDHKSIVRGLAWYKNTLYSCGFDKEICELDF